MKSLAYVPVREVGYLEMLWTGRVLSFLWYYDGVRRSFYLSMAVGSSHRVRAYTVQVRKTTTRVSYPAWKKESLIHCSRVCVCAYTQIFQWNHESMHMSNKTLSGYSSAAEVSYIAASVKHGQGVKCTRCGRSHIAAALHLQQLKKLRTRRATFQDRDGATTAAESCHRSAVFVVRVLDRQHRRWRWRAGERSCGDASGGGSGPSQAPVLNLNVFLGDPQPGVSL